MSLALKVENLSKVYRLGEIGTGTISSDLERWYAKVRGKEDPFLKIGEENDRSIKGTSDVVWSLRDVNFEIEEGDAVGIIGRNGAGKSTLLKILSRVTSPTTGTITGEGRIASLLEVGTGFHPELSGRENIFLNGAILGMRRSEIKRRFDEIVDFAGVERYIDTPVKRYSSGMYVRLAFAVAAHLESEILIVDEVLAVGDAEFQKKCLGKMGEVSKGEGRTVLFVSHNLDAVTQLCSKALVMRTGHVEFSGSVNEAVSLYLSKEQRTGIYKKAINNTAKKAEISQIRLLNDSGEICTNFLYNEPIEIEFQISIHDKDVTADLFVLILDNGRRRVCACEANYLKPEMRLTIKPEFLVRGDYSLHAFINNPGFMQLDLVEDVCSFRVIDNGSKMAKHGEYDYGKVFGQYDWN